MVRSKTKTARSSGRKTKGIVATPQRGASRFSAMIKVSFKAPAFEGGGNRGRRLKVQ